MKTLTNRQIVSAVLAGGALVTAAHIWLMGLENTLLIGAVSFVMTTLSLLI